MKIPKRSSCACMTLFVGLLILATGTPAQAQGGLWASMAPMPTARHGAVGGVIDGKLYVAGGYDGSATSGTLSVYDPATNAWTSLSSMTFPRTAASGNVIGGRLYVVGGRSPSNSQLNSLEVYDPASNTWTTKRPMPTARSVQSAVAYNGQLYVIGGCVGWCAPVTAVLEVYNPVTSTSCPMANNSSLHSRLASR